MTTFNEFETLASNATPSLPLWERIAKGTPRLLARNAHWALRASLASVLVYHGILKLTRIEAMAEMLQLSVFVVVLVALAELGGGAFVVLGGFARASRAGDWLTRIGAAMIAPVMPGAIAMVHWGQWSFVPSASHPMGGMQFQVVLLLIAAYFVVRGNDA